MIMDVVAFQNFLDFFYTDSSSRSRALLSRHPSAVHAPVCYREAWRWARFTIQLRAGVCVIGAILQTVSVQLAVMLVGRIITGWAVCIMGMSVPVY